MMTSSSSSKKICRLSIDYRLVCDGLIGDQYEYDPYVAHYTSFGIHRVAEKDNLVSLTVAASDIYQFKAKEGEEEKGEASDSEEEEDKKKKEIYMSQSIPAYRATQPIDITLLDYDQMKGDDIIHFMMFSRTRFSGVDSIDKTDAKYVERENSAGLCELELFELFHYYLQECDTNRRSNYNQKEVTFDVTDVFLDQKIIDEKLKDLLKNTMMAEGQGKTQTQLNQETVETLLRLGKNLTEKASITFRVTIRDFNYDLYCKSIFNVKSLKKTSLYSMLPLSQHQPQRRINTYASYSNKDNANSAVNLQLQQHQFDSLLFNSLASWKLMLKSLNNLLAVYCKHFISTDETGQCLYRPAENAISNLQLPMYVCDKGKLPVYAYWNNPDPYYREYPNAEVRDAELRLYGFNEKTEAYFMRLLAASLRRHALTEKSFIEAIEQHFSPQNSAVKLSPQFILAEEVVADVGTFLANSAYYTADYRLMTEAISLDASHHHHHHQRRHGSHHKEPRHRRGRENEMMGVTDADSDVSYHQSLAEMRRCSECGKELKMRVLSLDSWDSHLLNNLTKCDDCEGQDNAATTTIRALAIGRYDLQFRWASPAMQATQKLLRYSTIFDVGALVTSAFVDNNNKKIETKQEELPMIGSELDKNAENDGHCFGLMQSLSRSITMLQRGEIQKEILQSIQEANRLEGANAKQQVAFQLRDACRQVIVLEPTGSIEPRLLALSQSYSSDVCEESGAQALFLKKKAEMYFLKNLRLRLKATDVKESGIADLFMGEGLTHYVDAQPPQRRISSFYNSVVHGSSIDLMKRFDPTLSQMAFCKRIGKETCYGVRMGELIRDDTESHLSLICPYKDYKETWFKEIRPMVESVQNQMPVMKFGRYTDAEYRDEIYSRLLSPRDLSASFNFASPKAYQNESTKRDVAIFEKLLADTERLDSNKTLVRLYSRVWKLTQDQAKIERLNRFLTESPGLVKFIYSVEKQMPVCEPTVEILCIIDVKQCLGLPITAPNNK